jgi:hypothetical protein
MRPKRDLEPLPPADVWLREGNTLFYLRKTGEWRQPGEEWRTNAFAVKVEFNKSLATAEEADALVSHLMAALSGFPAALPDGREEE